MRVRLTLSLWRSLPGCRRRHPLRQKELREQGIAPYMGQGKRTSGPPAGAASLAPGASARATGTASG